MEFKIEQEPVSRRVSVHRKEEQQVVVVRQVIPV